MKVGITGFAGVGKTTVFTVLTGQEVTTHAPGERHLASVEVQDPRLDFLGALWNPRKFTRARFEVEDFPGLPSSDEKGRGEKVASLRVPEALLVVVGCFEEAVMTLPSSAAEPEAQWRALQEEFQLLDMEACERRIERVDKRLKKAGGDRTALGREREHVQELLALLEAGTPLPGESEDQNLRLVRLELGLFTDKPKVAVFNVEEGLDVCGEEAFRLTGLAANAAVLVGPVEREIAQLDGEDRAAFLAEYGLSEPAAERLTRLCYDAVQLLSFFTVGPDEVRAWPITSGSDAVTAAGKIHTDLARGFIRAEVTPFALVEGVKRLEDWKAVAKADLKGKDYVVADGDILNIRFSV